VPMTFLPNCCHGGGGFTTLRTRDGNVVGLVRDGRPEMVLMLHDFATGENWPREGPGGWQATSPRGERLRDGLSADHPGLRLVLND